MSEPTTVADGVVVTMHYTLTDDDGAVIDSSQDRAPLSYLHGASNIVPGLERQLSGKHVGDKVDAVVTPEDGYGEKSGPGLQTVPRSAFPDGADLKAGMQVMAQGPNGEAMPLWIAAVKENEVSVDTNHPLAGVTLHFAVEITSLRAASPEEVSHGHPHGPGGAHD